LFLREVLTTYPLLALPNFGEQFILDTDACDYAIGAVLSQTVDKAIKPVAYYSKALTKTQRNYSVSEKELLAIVFAVEHFHEYLFGVEFIINTDHQPLTGLFKATNAKSTSRLARWTTRLQNYTFKIRYKKGRKNGNADALSRWPDEDELDSTSEDFMDFLICVITIENEASSQASTSVADFVTLENQRQDPDLEWYLDTNTEDLLQVKPANSIRKELIKSRMQLLKGETALYFVPKSKSTPLLVLPSQLVEPAFRVLHASILSGHLGLKKTLSRFCDRFYRPFLKETITKMLQQCDICLRVKPAFKCFGTAHPNSADDAE
jgi:hypothetical protein